jgi:hypothetical protein
VITVIAPARVVAVQASPRAAPKPAPTNGSSVKITAVVVVSSRVCAQLNVTKAPPVAAAPRKMMPAAADPDVGGRIQLVVATP